MYSKYLHHPLFHLLSIILLGALGYLNSFGVPFVFDDLESILNNEAIRNLGNHLPGGSSYDSHHSRWVGYFTFALNYRFGGLDVAGYHIFNLAVHLGSALLVYTLVALTFRTPHLADSHLIPQAGIAALFAALFFAVHPVQTQAVTYVVQRLASLCTLLYLLSLALYATARVNQEGSGLKGRANWRLIVGGWRTLLLMTGSLTAAILAMFTKEIAFTLPLAILLYELCFFREQWQRRAMLLSPMLLTLAIIPATILSGDQLDDDGTLRETRLDIPRTHYLLTQLRVIVTYLRLLVWPTDQNLDYDYPVYTTFFTPPVFLSFLLLTALLAFAGWLFHKTSPQPPAPSPRFSAPEYRLVAFGICWFFLALAVESSLVPLADVIFEHRLYLPSVGPATALAVLILLASQKTTTWYGGRLPLLAAALVLVVLATATWQRNRVWQSEVSLWEDVARKSPGKVRPWYNLGTHLTDSGRPAEAIPVLTRAVTLDPQHGDAWHNLGRAYAMTDRAAEAVAPLRTAVRLKPDLDNAAVNLAAALLSTGQPAEAIPLLERVCRRQPDWPEARFNLGIAYVDVNDLDAARRELARLERLSPPHARALAKLIGRSTQ